MKLETEMFFGALMREDRSVLELIDSDFTYLNERLANHYGIDDVKGTEFQRVSLAKGSGRGGILTHASILTITSNPTRTSPVMRGKWIFEQISAHHHHRRRRTSRSWRKTRRRSPAARFVSDWKSTARKQSVPHVIQRWIRLALRWRTSTASALGGMWTANSQSTPPVNCPRERRINGPDGLKNVLKS